MRTSIVYILLLLSGIFPSVAQCQEQDVVDSLLVKLELAEEDSSMVYIYVGLSRAYDGYNLSKANEYANAALDIAKKTDDKRLVGYALFNLGDVNYLMGNFEMAIRQFYEYKEICLASGRDKDAAYALFNIGVMLMKIDDDVKAKQNFNKALHTFENLQSEAPTFKYSPEIISCLNNIGLIEKNSGNTDKALLFFNKGVNLARKTIGNDVYLAMLLNNIGSIYLDKMETGQAFRFFSEALQIREKLGDLNEKALSYRTMGEYYGKLGDHNKEELYLEKALEMTKQVGNRNLEAEITEMLFQTFYKQDNAVKALEYHIALKSLNDSISLDKSREELTRLELTSQFQAEERLRQLDEKRKEFRYLMIGIILLLSIVLITLFLLLSQNRLKRLKLEKENADLEKRNLILEKSTLQQELELRNKELTTNVMHQLRKNEVLQEIVEKLNTYQISDNPSGVDALTDIIKDLEKTQEETVWNEFELRFNQVHTNFYERLNSRHPDLTPNERKLCAFLKLNMSTKEIASVTGQTVRSIEVARTRLRKKLELTNSDSGLIEFLASI